MAPSGTARSTPATACVSPNDFSSPVASIARVIEILPQAPQGSRREFRPRLRRSVIGGQPLSSLCPAARGEIPGQGAQGNPPTCRWTGVSSPPATADERIPALPSALGDPRAGELLATVGELEMLARFDSGTSELRAERAVTLARDLGLTELEQRAQLIKADLLRRRGHVAEAGRIAQDVQRWATDNDSRR